MADPNGYTGIPDTLPEAQLEIVARMEEIKGLERSRDEWKRVADEGATIIAAVRAALEVRKD